MSSEATSGQGDKQRFVFPYRGRKIAHISLRRVVARTQVKFPAFSRPDEFTGKEKVRWTPESYHSQSSPIRLRGQALPFAGRSSCPPPFEAQLTSIAGEPCSLELVTAFKPIAFDDGGESI